MQALQRNENWVDEMEMAVQVREKHERQKREKRELVDERGMRERERDEGWESREKI